MIGSLRALFLQLFENSWSKKQWENEDCRLATAALLVRVATVNGEMSQARRVKLHAVLKSSFGLDYLTTSKLIDGAATAERSAIDLYYFIRQLNEVVDAEGRRKTVEMMWEIIYVDGNVNEWEVNIIWRASDLLGVSSRERIALRRRVAASQGRFCPQLVVDGMGRPHRRCARPSPRYAAFREALPSFADAPRVGCGESFDTDQ